MAVWGFFFRIIDLLVHSLGILGVGVAVGLGWVGCFSHPAAGSTDAFITLSSNSLQSSLGQECRPRRLYRAQFPHPPGARW